MASAAAPTPGERKIITVLFVDLVGSTELGDEEDPERTRRFLERFYGLTTSEIELAGGTIEKFVGDAVMAVFGTPVAQEDHAKRAVHAALGIRERLSADPRAVIAARIGINSGEVFVGAMRAGSGFASGDPVNIAARLEQGALPGQIIIGSRTAALVRGAFELGPALSLEAKGKRAPLIAHEVLGAMAAIEPGAVGPLGSSFVGRSAEVTKLEAVWQRVVARSEPQLLTVIGEPGIGKTSLVQHLLTWLSDQSPAPLRRSGRCLAYGKGSTYWPLAEVLREHLAIPRTATRNEVLARLHGREILGLTLGLDVAADLHPARRRELLHDAWVSLLWETASQQPTVLLIEDLHWAEQPLLDLLGELAREVRGPLMLLTTARPEFADAQPGWGGRLPFSAVWLEPLSSTDAGSMVSQLLGGEPPTGLATVVVDRAEGNPFFVEELLASLIDRGVLYPSDGQWKLTESDNLTMPDSIRAVIAARIDLLGPPEKAGLQAASIAGRTFATAAVVDLLAGGEPNFGYLEDRGFIRRHSHPSAGEREYLFKHALTREVAYASLPKGQRARLHAAFAERLQRIGESGDQSAFVLAHHYYEAVRPDLADLAWSDEPDRLAGLQQQAIQWLHRAGELTTGQFNIDDGLALLDRALTLDPSPETQALIWRAVGRAHALRYAGVDAVRAYETALQLTSDPVLQADIDAELALEVVQRYGMLNPMPDRALVDGWIDRALEVASPDTAARAKALAARALWSPRSAGVATEAVKIAEKLGDPELLSHAYNGLATVAFTQRRYDKARKWAEQRMALLDRISDPDHRVDIFSAVIPGLLGVGRFEEARRYAELHDEAASRLSTHHQVHAVAMKLELEELTGRWDLMRDLEARARTVVEANVATPCVRNARSLLACAVAEAVSGNDSRSRELEARAAAFEMSGYQGTLAPLRIRLSLARHDLAALAEQIEQAVPPPPAKNWWALNTESARLDAFVALRDRAAVESEAPAFVVPRTYLEPFALRALGIVRENEELVERALERFEAMGLRWQADQTRVILGQVARAEPGWPGPLR
jgi:class 3 adenylate cyclase/tetratricopeptide (TPR) repeat protein